jgi:hypothetical protein
MKDFSMPEDTVFLSSGDSYADVVALDRDEALAIAHGTPLQDLEGMCQVPGSSSYDIMQAPMHPIDQERMASTRACMALTQSEYTTQEVQDMLSENKDEAVRARMFASPFATAETLTVAYANLVAASRAEDAEMFEGYAEMAAIADNKSAPMELLEEIASDLDSDVRQQAAETLRRIENDGEQMTPRARVAAELARKAETDRGHQAAQDARSAEKLGR